MTSQNKIPANWNDGLKMADAIAKEITEVLPQCAVAAKQDDDEAYLLAKSLFRIGNLVGLSDLEMEKAYRSKEKP